MTFDEWKELVRARNQIVESPERLKIIEIIAKIKSNIGSRQAWAKELENALGVEPMTFTNIDKGDNND